MARLHSPFLRRSRLRPDSRWGAVLFAVVVSGTLASCGAGPSTIDFVQPQDAPAGVPQECTGPFPTAFGPASIDDVELLPDGWPEPPTGSTLCVTTETLEGAMESADYATTSSPEQVLEHYEGALPADISAVRADGDEGAMLTGMVGHITFQVTPTDGAFSIVLVDGGE